MRISAPRWLQRRSVARAGVGAPRWAPVPAIGAPLAEEETGGTALECTSRSEVLMDLLAGPGDLLTCEGQSECGWALLRQRDTGEKEACHERGQGQAGVGLGSGGGGPALLCWSWAGPWPWLAAGRTAALELVLAVADGGGWR
ncbi:hypothetical protein NDU88_006403 [Pleurodeles waltl]|uniref:Uncharacterized protein n=1 Tax=Pleurodeles waltl TaxID=8319 RepID=A0AAV7N0R4_PLEWA|nr:hypothetical protein NDU88_006403 [Pleurodeles waltl]